MKKAIGFILAGASGALFTYYLNDPILALIIIIPVILLLQFLQKRIDRNK